MVGRGRVATTFGKLITDGVLEIGDGYRAKNEELGGDGPIFLRAGHVKDTHIDFAGVERFHASLVDKVRSKMSRAGDAIVTTKGNSTGRTAFVTALSPQFVYSPHLSLTLANLGSAWESVFCRANGYGGEFCHCLGLAVTLMKLTRPIFCASNDR